ncbi:MAG TPA: ABC-three component system middle component 5 [Pyrinomonadaceae bacterium]|jgi:hypothetical protein
MLTYHPAFDIYHCAFRILLLADKMPMQVIEVDRMRIWDFYFVFPNQLKNVSFPRDLWSLKSGIKNEENPYEDLRNSEIMFERMKPFQLSALKYLAGYGFIDSEALSNNNIKRTTKKIPKKLSSKMVELDSQQEYLIKLLSSPFNELPLYGDKGLKARTKLIDFKYDAAA